MQKKHTYAKKADRKAADNRIVQTAADAGTDFGPLIIVAKRGQAALNQAAVARRFASQTHVGYDQEQRGFYRYVADRGVWLPTPEYDLKQQLAQFIRATAHSEEQPVVAYRINAGLLNSLVEMLKCVACFGVGRPNTDGLILVKNGVLDLTGDKPVLRDFSPDLRFTHGFDFPFDAKAGCGVFRKELLASAFGDEDTSRVQCYCGSMLLGPNHSHGILLLQGTPGGGKSTFVTVMEFMIGRHRVAYLRPSHLLGRFELSGFLGKRLLTGKDVPGDTLSNAGAKLLKSLVGGDLLEGEIKYNPVKSQVVGDFHVIIACNNGLRIALDGDEEAWRRRLVLIKYDRPRPETIIPNLAEVLLNTEAPGILAWLVEGAMAYKRELAKHGTMQLTASQQARVDDLIDHSQSAQRFLQTSLIPTAKGGVAVADLTQAYFDYCRGKGWTSLTERQFENALPSLMTSLFRVTKRNDIERNGKFARGFSGVVLANQ